MSLHGRGIPATQAARISDGQDTRLLSIIEIRPQDGLHIAKGQGTLPKQWASRRLRRTRTSGRIHALDEDGLVKCENPHKTRPAPRSNVDPPRAQEREMANGHKQQMTGAVTQWPEYPTKGPPPQTNVRRPAAHVQQDVLQSIDIDGNEKENPPLLFWCETENPKVQKRWKSCGGERGRGCVPHSQAV